jgi:hypothetical protein
MFVPGLWQPDRLAVLWSESTSLLVFLCSEYIGNISSWIVNPIYQAVWNHIQTDCYVVVPCHQNLMPWKVTVVVWHCSQFQLYFSTGVVDRSPASDSDFEQGGSPLVSMPAIPVIHLLSDSQLLEKVLLQLYLVNIINNFLILNLHAHTFTFIHLLIYLFIHSFIHYVSCLTIGP